MPADPPRDAAPGLAESTAFAIMMAIAAYLGRENPRFVYPQILWSFLGLMAANLLHFSVLPSRVTARARARGSVALNSILIAVIMHYSGGRESYFWVMFLWPLFSAVVASADDREVLTAALLALALLGGFYADALRRGIWAEILELLVKMLTLVAAVGMAARVAAAERRARRELVAEQERAQRERLAARDTLQHMDRLATLGTLSAGIAHELNGPLAAILGFAEAEGADDPDEAPRTLRRIAANARRCRDTIQNTLAFARRGRVERAPSDLNALVRQCVHLKKSDWLGLDLAVEENYAALPLVPVSGPELQQVVFNLLTNADQALRAAASAGARIRVSTAADGEWARVTVEDNGPGIPPAVLERIWEPFFTTKPAGQGTGLGLSICRRIVEGHGGRLRVESRPGRTAFMIELPLPEPPKPAAGN